MLVEILLTDESVGAAGHARIRRKNDHGVRRLRRGFDGIEDPTNLQIQETDVAIVVREHLLDGRRLARPKQEQFIPERHVTVIERMLRQEVSRQRNLGGVVGHRKTVRYDMRVMRAIESQVSIERLRWVVGFDKA